MRLTLVISALERGGAERILSVLASAWARQGRQVTLITFDDREPPAYNLDPAIVLKSLRVSKEAAGNPLRALYRNLKRIVRLRRLIRKSQPDLVLSFLDFSNIITLLATRGMHVPVIVSERANPAFDDLKGLWRMLRRRLYPRAAALVCQTSAMVRQIHETISVPGYAIPNPVEVPSAVAYVGERLAQPTSHTLVAMGRLVPQKGFDLLLEAFSRIAARYPEWSITILGQGPLQEPLQQQARSLGLEGRVRFSGAVSDPFQALRAADLFVFSSRFEGFGNALAEAMACGLPVISFDCPAGPSEIIRNGVDGVLVPPEDIAALATAMDRLMSDPLERARLSRRAPEILDRFSLASVLGIWEDLFTRVLGRESVRRVEPQSQSRSRGSD